MVKKRYLLIIVIIFIISLIFIKYSNETNEIDKPSIELDARIPENQSFKDCTNSDNFNYKAKIILNDIIKYENKISLRYNIDIESKNNNTYKNVMATSFIDEKLLKLLAVRTRTSFGSNSEENIIIDNKDNKGLVIGLTTWLNKELSEEKLINQVKNPIKLKVTWDGGEEYVYIPKEKIEVIYKDSEQ